MSNVIQLPVIAGVEITTDAEGRFNLNALHQAHLAANPRMHRNSKQPADWMKLDGTRELVEEISNSEDLRFSPIESKAGRYGGTFAHELLAISYAGWISPAFQIKVNQVFLDYRAGKLAPTSPDRLDRKALAQMVIEAEEEAEQLRLENHAKDDHIKRLENFFQPGMTITAFGKMLNGVNCAQMNNYCHEKLNWLYNESRSGKNKRWRARSNARDKYLTETNRSIGRHGDDPFIKHEPKLLQEGAKKLYQLYLDGELPMKKTWSGEYTHLKFTEVAA